MAKLFHKQTQETVFLRVNHTFGRNLESNMTVLNSPGASRNHASIVWDGEIWKIKDTSSNGCYLNKCRIAPGKYHPLLAGATIQFGNLPLETWEVLDLKPPIPGLISVDDPSQFIPLYDVFLLPVERSKIIIFLSEAGHWTCETEGHTAVLQSGDKVGVPDQYWIFVDARPNSSTATLIASPPLENIQFHFQANRNEEHVSLTLMIEETRIDLGERNHHYLLLLLARQRIHDIEKNYPELDQGWIKKDVLTHMMGMAEQHINIQIHRFRKQVASQLPLQYTLHQVVERRPGELRLAYSDIRIFGGFQTAVTN